MVVWRVGLSKVVIEEEESSTYTDVGEALAAVGELEDFLGLEGIREIRLVGLKQSPVTGELLMVTLKSEVQNG